MHQDLIIFACSALVLAATAAIWLLRRSKQRRAKNWPMAAGRVESAVVTLEFDEGQPGSAAHYSELKYSYEARAQAHCDSMRRRFMLRGRAEKWIRQVL